MKKLLLTLIAVILFFTWVAFYHKPKVDNLEIVGKVEFIGCPVEIYIAKDKDITLKNYVDLLRQKKEYKINIIPYNQALLPLVYHVMGKYKFTIENFTLKGETNEN